MTELLTYLVRNIVDDPDAVRITREDQQGYLELLIHVAPDDIGKVIGKSGRVIKALRTLMRAAGMSENRKVLVEIVE